MRKEDKAMENKTKKEINPMQTVNGRIRVPYKGKLCQEGEEWCIAKSAIKPTKRAREIANYYIAIAMIKRFKYLPWMTHETVTGPDYEKITIGGSIYIDDSLAPKTKFKRKCRN